MRTNLLKWSGASALALVVALSLSLGSASAQVRLSDVVAFGADATGNWFGQPDVWETRSGGNFNNWIQSGAFGGPFLNGPSDASVQPNIALSLGVNSFRILGAPGIDNPYFGINLFFNDSATPSISAFASMLNNPMGAHSFAADGAANTPRAVPGFNTGYLFPGAGTLSFVSGDQLITLVDFYWATPSVYGLDLTGQSSTGPDGAEDYVGGIALSVTPVPEPSSMALGICAGLCVFGLHWSNHTK